MTIKDVLYGVSKGLPAVIPNNYVANFIDLNPNTQYSNPTCGSKNIEVDANDNVIVYSGFSASVSNQYFTRYAVYDKTGKRLVKGGDYYDYASLFSIGNVKKSNIDGSYYTIGARTLTGQNVFIAKHSANGQGLWGYRIGSLSTLSWSDPSGVQNRMTIDSSDNCYIFGSDGFYLRVIKITPDGVVSWSTRNEIYYWTPAGIQVMPNGNICLVGYNNLLQPFMVIINTSGTIISNLQYSLPNYPSNYHKAHTLCIDANNNIYVGFNRVSNTGTFGIKLVKFNSSGVFQWGKEVIEYLPGYGAYVAVNPSPPYDCYITGVNGNTYAFSSSGTLLWKRVMGGGDHPTGIGVDSKEGLIIQQGFFIGRFPTDGTKTGTYAVPGGGNFTWSAGSQTITDVTSFPTITSNFTLITATLSKESNYNMPSPYTYPTPQDNKTVF